LKIAMVSPYDFTWPGGVTGHVSQLARELTKLGHHVQILAPHSPARDNAEATKFVPMGRSVPLPSGGSIARVSLSWWLYRKIKNLLAEEAFDIIHLHEPLAPLLPLCVLQSSTTVNVGTFHASYRRRFLYQVSYPIIKRWHRRLHGIIAVSPAAYRYVSSTFPGNYEIIPNGIDVDHFATKAIPWPEYQDGKTNILFVGRLEKRKGLKYLLEAFSRLKWEFDNIRLLVVGPGDLDADSHRVLGARKLEDVVMVGPVSYDELPRYYASADVFCSPATGSESFGIVLLEAMACGKPIVVSNIDGYNDIIENGQQGFLFERKSSESLAQALKTLIEDPILAQRMGAVGRKTVDKYRWELVAKLVESYYLRCLDLTNGHTSKRAA
jgi:phosphatidylinositol alpha-mannosyltransferase